MAEQVKTAKKSRPKSRGINLVADILIYIFVGLVSLTCVLPYIHVIAKSFSSESFVIAKKVFLLPKGFTPEAYIKIFHDNSFIVSFGVTVLMTVLFTVLGMVITICAAYPLSRKELRGRKVINLLFIFTMYFGGGLVPYYMVLKGIHMLNTFWVFIFPLMMSVYNMILVRSYVESMPESLFEAAKIDGATELTVFFRLVLPLSKPILMTIGLFVAVNQWNSWFDAYLYTSAQSLKPMQSVLVEILNQYQTGGSVSQQMSNAKSGMTVTPDSIRMAATMVATIPIIMVYPFIQKYFVKGIMLGAVKA